MKQALYPRRFKSRMFRWAVNVDVKGDTRTAYGILVDRPLGKCPLGRPNTREGNIEICVKEINGR
jgi:hypothetical protein